MPTSQPQGGSTIDILDQLERDTSSSLSKIQQRTEGPTMDQKLEELQAEMDRAVQIKDDKERDIRVRVLTTTLEKLREDAAQEEQDLAQAVLGLNAKIESLGDEYKVLNVQAPEELAVITRAQARLTEAKNAVPNREIELANIAEMWFEFRRRKARAKLEEQIKLAEAQVQNAEQGLVEAQAESKRMQRQRLMKAKMDASIQEFTVRVAKTIEIMQRRVEVVKGEIASVKARKAQSFDIKERAAKAVEDLDAKLNQAEAQLKDEEEKLTSLANGTEEYAKQTEIISNKRAEVEELRGRRNTAHVLFQSKERFAIELETHERTQMKLRDNLTMWITLLRSDTEARVTTFKSRLEAMKAMSDQDVAKDLDKLGVAMDRNNAEYMAQAGAVSDRLRVDRMEQHPQIVKKLMEIAAAQAQAHQVIREREAEVLRVFREKYGIDPMSTSFFTYAHHNDGVTSGAPSGSAGEPSSADVLGQ